MSKIRTIPLTFLALFLAVLFSAKFLLRQLFSKIISTAGQFLGITVNHSPLLGRWREETKVLRLVVYSIMQRKLQRVEELEIPINTGVTVIFL
ncbi:MAG: hypothetical protein MUP55_02895 [Candidatus Aenigmarchaeota archaeon]|nr:hypothetical protein [Candidatus Aenigmarchaeota archaeon]